MKRFAGTLLMGLVVILGTGWLLVWMWHRINAGPAPAELFPPRITHIAGTGKTISLGFIGDSITRNIPPDSNMAPPEEIGQILNKRTGISVTIVNCGVPGYSSSQLLEDGDYQAAMLRAFEEQGVTTIMMCAGTNDSRQEHRTSADRYRINMERLVEIVKSRGYRVIVNRPIWFDAVRFAGLHNDPEGCQRLFDSYQYPWNGDTAAYAYFKAHPEELMDGVHPSRLGAKHLAEYWQKVL